MSTLETPEFTLTLDDVDLRRDAQPLVDSPQPVASIEQGRGSVDDHEIAQLPVTERLLPLNGAGQRRCDRRLHLVAGERAGVEGQR